jgi:hypothetical protein
LYKGKSGNPDLYVGTFAPLIPATK